MTTPADLRLGVWLLGALIVLAASPFSPRFLVPALLPVPLTLLVLRGSRGARVASAVDEVVSRRVVRVALLLLTAFLIATGIVLGPFAGLLLSAWVLFLLLGVGAWRGSTALGDVAASGAILSVTLTVAIAGLELFLTHSAVGVRLGIPREQQRWEAKYDSLWSRNVFGYRTPHERIARRPGIRRILALGDSYTWGDKVASSDSTWPALLEQRLGRDSTEVWNLGQRGWTTANEAEQLARMGWQLRPDAIVIQWFANDALRSGPGFSREGEAWVQMLPARFRRYEAGGSATLYLIERAANQLIRSGARGGGYGSLYATEGAGWQQLQDALRAVGDSAKSHHVPVLLILYPAFVPGTWTSESYPLRSIHDQVAHAGTAAGLTVLDLADAFARQGGDWRRWWALSWDHHPSAAAHAVAAQAIAERLLPMLSPPAR